MSAQMERKFDDLEALISRYMGLIVDMMVEPPNSPEYIKDVYKSILQEEQRKYREINEEHCQIIDDILAIFDIHADPTKLLHYYLFTTNLLKENIEKKFTELQWVLPTLDSINLERSEWEKEARRRAKIFGDFIERLEF